MAANKSGVKVKQTVAQSSLDTAGFEKSWTRVRPLAEKLSPDEVVDARLDVVKAAQFALRAERFWNTPGVKKRLTRLPAQEFDQKVLAALPDLTRALIYAKQRSASAAALATEAQVPMAIVTEAYALRERMLKVAAYNLDDETSQKEIASIRSGTGYQDLALDLARCATLYANNLATLAKDKVQFKKADIARANELSARIFGAVNASNDQTWNDAASRVFTLFKRSWDELSAAGQFLFRHDAEALANFGSLYTASRSAPSGSATSEPTPAPAPAPAN